MISTIFQNKKIFIWSLVATLFMFCSPDDDSNNLYPEVVPNFSFSIDHLTKEVTFTNTSTGGNIYLWDFGDGNTSTEANPIHTYEADGTYTVTLTVTNAAGTSESISYEVIVDLNNVCSGDDPQSENAADFHISFSDEPTTVADGVEFSREFNPNSSGINTSCYSGLITRTEAHSFVNLQFNVDSKFNFDTQNGFTMKVFSPNVGSTVTLKLEDQQDSNVFVEFQAITTVANEWEELEFFFGASANDLYDKIVLFFDLGQTNTNMYYFDDLQLDTVEEITCDSETAQNTDPGAGPLNITFLGGANLFESFGDMEGEVVDNSVWDDNNSSCYIYKYVKTASAQTWAGIAYSGGFENAIEPATQPSNFKMKVFSQDRVGEVTIRLEFEPFPNVDPAVNITASTTQVGVWEELSFDFSAHTDKTFKSMVIYVDEGQAGDDAIFYFDDITQNESTSGCAEETVANNINPETGLNISFKDGENPMDAFGNMTGEVVSNPFESGINTSCNVYKYVKTATAETWSGVGIAGGMETSIVPGSQSGIIKLKALGASRTGDVTVRLEFEPFPNVDPAVEVIQSISNVGEWEELTFDFSAHTDKTFKSLIIYVDKEANFDDAEFYIDDIVQE